MEEGAKLFAESANLVGESILILFSVRTLQKVARARRGSRAGKPKRKGLLNRVNELEIPFTKDNFRRNLAKLWDLDPPPAGYDAHHVFPQNLEKDFRKWVPDLDIHDPAFGAWWKQSAHRKVVIEYEQAWRDFLGQRRSLDDMVNHGRKLAKEFGFDWAH